MNAVLVATVRFEEAGPDGSNNASTGVNRTHQEEIPFDAAYFQDPGPPRHLLRASQRYHPVMMYASWPPVEHQVHYQQIHVHSRVFFTPPLLPLLLIKEGATYDINCC